MPRTATGDGQGGGTVQQLPPDTYIVTGDAPSFAKVQATDVTTAMSGTEALPVGFAVASGKGKEGVAFRGYAGPDVRTGARSQFFA